MDGPVPCVRRVEYDGGGNGCDREEGLVRTGFCSGFRPEAYAHIGCDHITDGRRAVTHWTVLGRYNGFTHIQCRLETGRTHQIRVHMASIGHPLVGDPVYGGNRKSLPGLTGQCLHARKLRFIHPASKEPVEVECPLPDWFERVLRQIDR